MARRIYILPVVLAVACIGLFVQSSPPASTYHDVLGFSLMPGANSSPVSFHIVRKFDDPALAIEAHSISKGEFMAVATGWGDCPANPDHKNLFDQYEVANCGWHGDTIIRHVLYKGGFGCSPVDDLWRLGYNEYPYGPAPSGGKQQQQTVNNPEGPGPGWARNPLSPSEGQTSILQGYGAVFFTDIIYGENAFRLLHDMQDPEWVSRYKSS